jgi:hypothetical protein
LVLQVRADLESAGKLLAKRAQQQLKHNDSGKSEASIFMPPPPSAEDMGGAPLLSSPVVLQCWLRMGSC